MKPWEARPAMSCRIRVCSAAAAAAFLIASTQGASAQNPFATLVGSWSGSGQVRLVDGKTEAIRCRASYTNKEGGAGLGLSLRCASASNKIEMLANLSYTSGDISGSWEERSYNATGSVSGFATASKLNLSITGGVNGSMLVSVNGRAHSVSIKTDNPTLKGVDISLSKS